MPGDIKKENIYNLGCDSGSVEHMKVGKMGTGKMGTSVLFIHLDKKPAILSRKTTYC
jgi:hypothetical protein